MRLAFDRKGLFRVVYSTRGAGTLTMKLIVGLGNPGHEYAKTRHNIGFRVIDRFAERFRITLAGHEKDAFVGTGRVAGETVMLAKPQTFMNRSGDSVAKLARSYTETLGELLVVYDDIDLPAGRLRIRPSGSTGTHNGMRSIVTSIGSDAFPRLRFGVRGETYDDATGLADYVLQNFTTDEETTVVGSSIERATDAMLLFARGDLKRAMNEFNRTDSQLPE